jgi:hypothetical protein
MDDFKSRNVQALLVDNRISHETKTIICKKGNEHMLFNESLISEFSVTYRQSL